MTAASKLGTLHLRHPYTPGNFPTPHGSVCMLILLARFSTTCSSLWYRCLHEMAQSYPLAHCHIAIRHREATKCFRIARLAPNSHDQQRPMRTLAGTRPQQLFWVLLSSQCHLSVAWRNDSSSGSRTRPLLFQCDLSPTWGYIRQRFSLCRCSLLCESIPKLAALQPLWQREQFGILRKLFETLY